MDIILILVMSVFIFGIVYFKDKQLEKMVRNRTLELEKQVIHLEQQLRIKCAIFDAEPDATLISDEKGTIIMVNNQVETLLGYQASELVGQSIEILIPERFHQRHPQLRATYCNHPYPRLMGNFPNVSAWHKNQYEIDVEISLSPIETEEGFLFASSLREITKRKQLEAELRIASAAFESNEAMIITNPENVILRVNTAFTKLTGYTPEEAIGQTPSFLRSGHHDSEFYKKMWDALNRLGSWEGEIWDRRKNGEVYPKWLLITAVKNEDGVITNYVGAQYDITEWKAEDKKMRDLAYYDPLTQLPNRRFLQERLEHSIALAQRQNKNFSILMLDLDKFKAVNDNLGHLAGDELLQQVASRLISCLRESDTVARLGGDEFIILLETVMQPDDSSLVAKNIVEQLSLPFHLTQSDNVSIGTSVGISVYPQDGENATVLIANADAALYRAKANGRGCFVYFSEIRQEEAS